MMNLVHWKPLGELERFRKEMDNLLKDFWGEQSLDPDFTRQWTPSADISETRDAVIVRAELPGLDAKDIEVTLSGGLLTIRGEKKEEKEETGEQRYYAERYVGSFQRVFQIPANVQTDKVKAGFDKGVLKITIPKTDEARTKEIKVEVK